MLELGQQLKLARKEKGLTLRELATVAGVHLVTLSRFENGLTDLGARKLNRLAHALGRELTLTPAQRGYTLDDLAKGAMSSAALSRTDRTKPESVLRRSKALRR